MEILISGFCYKGKREVLVLLSPFGNNWRDLTGSSCLHSPVSKTHLPPDPFRHFCVCNPPLQPSFFTKHSVAGAMVENYTALCSEKGTDLI